MHEQRVDALLVEVFPSRRPLLVTIQRVHDGVEAVDVVAFHADDGLHQHVAVLQSVVDQQFVVVVWGGRGGVII